jgi:maltooligosyltrehalose trehalohydrolase
VTFLVWAPNARSVDIHVVSPVDRVIRAEHASDGYYFAADLELKPGAKYFYRLNGGAERPDPASRSQPEGVHGPSEVIESPAPVETWPAPALRDYIIYELHTGTFTREGTFDAAIRELDRLRSLGITVIELMPVADFPGARNWGYDGVFLSLRRAATAASPHCYG